MSFAIDDNNDCRHPTKNVRTTTRRRLLGFGAALAASTFLPRAPARAQAAAKRIRYAHSTPTTHAWHLWGEQFKTAIEAKTSGKIQVIIYPNAQMGNERDIAQAIRLGSLEMGSVG